jgi:plasmid stabilization system protein ParE
LDRQASSELADRIVSAIREKFVFLAQNPGAGHLRKDLIDEDVRFVSVYSYLIVYRPVVRPLQVVAILHGRRDIPEILKSRA